MNYQRAIGALLVAAVVAVMGSVMSANDATVTYSGQGFNFDGTTWNLNDSRCGAEGDGLANDGGAGQFANWNGEGQPYVTGQPYLVWVLTANGATSATLHLPDGEVLMKKVGGTYKYASKYYPQADLVAFPVHAAVTGKLKGNMQLVVSHGCAPLTTEGAWCSPGFWKNASDAAWALTGQTKQDLFNATVVPNFYVTPSVENPTLTDVLTAKGEGGANKFGEADAPFTLNAFNATGAFLTNAIPGFAFDQAAMALNNDAISCPIDNHGNIKPPQK